MTCFSTEAWLTNRLCGDAEVGPALGHRREHFPLAARQQRRSGSPRVWRPSIRATTSGSSARAARGDPADRVDERGDVADPFLEQVAHALGSLADELHDVGGLAELRQDEHAGPGPAAAQLERGLQAVVLAARWHLHVGDDDVGTVGRARGAAGRRRRRTRPTTSSPASTRIRAMPSRSSTSSSPRVTRSAAAVRTHIVGTAGEPVRRPCENGPRARAGLRSRRRSPIQPMPSA